MKKLSTLLALTLITNFMFSQCNDRYQTEIFSSVTKTTVNYSDVYNDNEHKMDIYTPNGDTVTNRPVILYMHAGAFYGGDKTMTDCVDFCESMAKRGYVTASVNFRITNIIAFLSSQEEQYKIVLKSVADAKAAVRYFRKDHAINANTYGIDPSTIFVGGYSSGGVISVHMAFIDDISDLPTAPINIQALVSTIGGNLEGDAGNLGYSSDVQGVISFAGGINDVNWIDGNDEPLVSIQGTADLTVNYNCGPGTNNPLVLDLCGAGEMHPQADNVGLLNDKLIFTGEGHTWAAYGNINSKFVQALDFTKDFLYPLRPCNNTTAVNELSAEKKLIKIVDVLGRDAKLQNNTPLFYIYDDGSVKQKMIIK
jgi:dienelactone hydrolase